MCKAKNSWSKHYGFQLPKIWPLYLPSVFENTVTAASLWQMWRMISNCSEGSMIKPYHYLHSMREFSSDLFLKIHFLGEEYMGPYYCCNFLLVYNHFETTSKNVILFY